MRYLGYQNTQPINQAMLELITECIDEITNTARPLYVYGSFNLIRLDQNLYIKDTKINLPGKAILDHLDGANSCYFLAATLGYGVERLMMEYESSNLSKMLILDACCNDFIEKICDQAQGEINEKAAQDGLFTNSRYSPGYGDFDLSFQPVLLNILNAPKTIGLTANEHFILMPRKSVTAVIGVFNTPQVGSARCKKQCGTCNMKDTCRYKNK